MQQYLLRFFRMNVHDRPDCLDLAGLQLAAQLAFQPSEHMVRECNPIIPEAFGLLTET
jgi:hypothetical protein